MSFDVVFKKSCDKRRRSVISCLRQVFVIFLLNIPVFSFGLSVGWVSGVSVGDDPDNDITDTATVLGAAGTFVVAAIGAPLFTRLATLTSPRLALMSTAALFGVCWSIKLCSNNDIAVIAARAIAGLGGAGGWSLSPILAAEVCEPRWRGAASSAVALAHQLGMLVSYTCSATDLSRHVVEAIGLGVALLHCLLYRLAPEFPAYLALRGRHQDAIQSLSWLRCRDPDDEELSKELNNLPPPTAQLSHLKEVKLIFNDPRICRTFITVFICVVAQEMCGILALMHYAERIFQMAEESTGQALVSPAGQAVVLGAVQLLGSMMLMVIVDKTGRKNLLFWSSLATTLSILGACISILVDGAGVSAPILLAIAAFSDSAGVQGVPYIIQSESMPENLKNAASGLIGIAGGLANAIELILFPLLVKCGGLIAGFATSVVLTALYTLFVLLKVPETKGLSVEEVQIKISKFYCICGSQMDKKCVNHKCDNNYVTKL